MSHSRVTRQKEEKSRPHAKKATERGRIYEKIMHWELKNGWIKKRLSSLFPNIKRFSDVFPSPHKPLSFFILPLSNPDNDSNSVCTWLSGQRGPHWDRGPTEQKKDTNKRGGYKKSYPHAFLSCIVCSVANGTWVGLGLTEKSLIRCEWESTLIHGGTFCLGFSFIFSPFLHFFISSFFLRSKFQ